MHPVVLAALLGTEQFVGEQADERRKDRDFNRDVRERERMLGVEGSARAAQEEESEARRREGAAWDDSQALTHEQNRAALPHKAAAEGRAVSGEERDAEMHDLTVEEIERKQKEAMRDAKKKEQTDSLVKRWRREKMPFDEEIVVGIESEDPGAILRALNKISKAAEELGITKTDAYQDWNLKHRLPVLNAHSKPKPEAPEDLVARFKALMDEQGQGPGETPAAGDTTGAAIPDSVKPPARREPFAPGTTIFQAPGTAPAGAAAAGPDREAMIAYLLSTGQAVDRADAEQKLEDLMREEEMTR